MPKETIKYGRDYATVTVHESEQHAGYTYELAAPEAHSKVASGDIRGADVVLSNKPRLDVHWDRPIDRLSLSLGEEPKGSVQVSITLNPTDMKWLVQHLHEHPEDIEAMSTFVTESLGRYEINHAIRTLKRARDTAYGADE